MRTYLLFYLALLSSCFLYSQNINVFLTTDSNVQCEIFTNDDYHASEIVIYNMSGITLSRKLLQEKATSTTMNVASLRPGSYIVALQYSDGQKAYQQLIKK